MIAMRKRPMKYESLLQPHPSSQRRCDESNNEKNQCIVQHNFLKDYAKTGRSFDSSPSQLFSSGSFDQIVSQELAKQIPSQVFRENRGIHPYSHTVF
jgi:hypothetical protein